MMRFLSLSIRHAWRVTLFALLGATPCRVDQVPLWALCVPFRRWPRVARHDGRTFAQLHSGGISGVWRKLVPLRALYLAFLYTFPLAALLRGIELAWRGKGEDTSTAAGVRWACRMLKRPDLFAAHSHAWCTDQEAAWSRPDYAAAMFHAWSYVPGATTYHALDDKRAFHAACSKAGFPVPERVTREEALARGGTFYAKLPKSDLGYGVETVTAEELAHIPNTDHLVLEVPLPSHPTIVSLVSETGPLSTFRVLTWCAVPGEPHMLRTAVRLGRPGSEVDNTQQGGLWVNVDPATHRLREAVTKKTFGLWKDGRPVRYRQHPDTLAELVGVEVPFAATCIELALRAQRELAPLAPTLGWDVALTADGPVLLEVNVWATCYDDAPLSDAFTPVCEAILAGLARVF